MYLSPLYTCYVLTFVDTIDMLLISHIHSFHTTEVTLVKNTNYSLYIIHYTLNLRNTSCTISLLQDHFGYEMQLCLNSTSFSSDANSLWLSQQKT